MHNAPGADIEMADFAVAHLPFRQANSGPGSLDQGVGKLANQFVVSRLARQGDRVALRLCAVAPSVQHRQHNGFRPFSHGSSGYTNSNSGRQPYELKRMQKSSRRHSMIGRFLPGLRRTQSHCKRLREVLPEFEARNISSELLVVAGLVSNHSSQTVEMAAGTKVISSIPQRV